MSKTNEPQYSTEQNKTANGQLHADTDVEKQNSTFTGFPPSGSMLCPRCDYSLEGLPAKYTCPECGLIFDSETRVWRPNLKRGGKSWRHRRFVFVLYIFAIVAAITNFALSRFTDWSSIAILFLLSGNWFILKHLYNKCVAVTPEGLFLRRGIQSNLMYAWSEIDKFDIIPTGATSRIEVRLKNKKSFSLTQLETLFKTSEDLEKLIDRYIPNTKPKADRDS